jgi:pimeloyl-ACP methyl ester carboxylesterase
VRFYLKAPRLLLPLFMLASLRMYREIAAASSSRWQSLVMSAHHCRTALTHMFSPSRMARRAKMLPGRALGRELATVRGPVQIVTGDVHLDRVVPVGLTLEYAQHCPHARVERIDRTGHVGLITRAAAFAEIVGQFSDEACGRTQSRRRIG